MHRKKKPFGRPNQIHHACEPVIKKIFKIPRTHQHEPNLKSILSMLMVMNRSDAGSTQDCFAFSTFYNHISTPTMVVQVTKKKVHRFAPTVISIISMPKSKYLDLDGSNCETRVLP